MTLAEKIRILRENREWTQAILAEKLSLSPDTVQKWEKGKNVPPLAEIKRLAEVFGVSISNLIDDGFEFPKFYRIGIRYSEEFYPELISSDHVLYDANLKYGATLHRYLNRAGYEYSAIYTGMKEWLTCERKYEQGMIDCWNDLKL